MGKSGERLIENENSKCKTEKLCLKMYFESFFIPNFDKSVSFVNILFENPTININSFI